jgi:hypothetical protein
MSNMMAEKDLLSNMTAEKNVWIEKKDQIESPDTILLILFFFLYRWFHFHRLYQWLGTKEGKKDIYRMAKS